jgi:hypothetical protein
LENFFYNNFKDSEEVSFFLLSLFSPKILSINVNNPFAGPEA